MHLRQPRLSPLARLFQRAVLPALALAAAAPGVRAQALEAPAATVEVIGTSPLPGQGVDRNLLPYATQSVRRERLDEAQADNLLDFMNRHLPGVQVNDVQGSPFQGDLTYRGFRASPLLGAAQGLSVYLDGVRINEPFGDVVNWDLVPEFALNSVTLVPGANPAFGLNSLGGALSLTTHTGRTAPGWRAEVSAGSFNRKRLDLSHGTSSEDGWHSFVAGTLFDENGWRDHSEGRLGNLLAKVGHGAGPTEWDLSLQLGRSRLVGNGLVPAYTLEEGDGGVSRVPDLYAGRREAVYTHPDRSTNRLAQLGLNVRHQIDDRTELAALAYVRHSRRDTVNGDQADEPEDEANASFNTTQTRQRGVGAALNLSGTRGAHQWQVGATVDASRTRFRETEQEALFTADRGVTPGDEEAELGARVTGRSIAFGLYGTDTWRVAPRTHVTGTLRYNHARVSNQLTSVDDDTGEVRERPNEKFRYNSLNPALGIAHRLEAGPTLFANLARNNRVPTVIELGCADPQEPCRLPAGLQADPYLKQVISRTAEVGVRWPLSRSLQLGVAAYRTVNRDDILFRSVSATSQQGYFQNFPRTRNQGVDLDLQGRMGAVSWTVGYSFLQATYEATGLLRQGERNIEVTPGTRIAGLPRHSLKLSADWRFSPGWSLGGDLQAVSRRVTAGNEDGRIEDGEDERADLSLPGHAVLNLRASWRPQALPQQQGWELFAKVNNVFDRRYENFAALASTVFDAAGNYSGEERDAVFVAPGAPRSVFIGARYRF
ncbi:TonB-dependent receptor [Azohydromonas caseinilytica]|uniref:TonB-dependent receptor n=1 Tax=Azohydromonas caseinilytica TaxID=2728836 RepID=A0A848FAK0_9BURK|nr:TonB-dependent receptor [Azohydromonas caseinilytica]NML15775.1 TonB-dependent receptor [Azohydromonas caseinilytica]